MSNGIAIMMGILLVAVFLGVFFEVGILAYAYFNADEVKCNWLWCEFSSSKISQDCYMNGQIINCSSIIYNDMWGGK